MVIIKCSNIGKEEREDETLWTQGKGISLGFCFVGQDVIECVIEFRTDSHTIKWGNSSEMWLSNCH